MRKNADTAFAAPVRSETNAWARPIRFAMIWTQFIGGWLRLRICIIQSRVEMPLELDADMLAVARGWSGGGSEKQLMCDIYVSDIYRDLQCVT